MQKKRVYIAHPLTSYGCPQSNQDTVTRICQNIAQNEPDVIPISPVHAFQFMDRNGPQDKVIEYCKSLLLMCHEIRFFGEWWKSEGCVQEFAFATENNIPVVQVINCQKEVS